MKLWLWALLFVSVAAFSETSEDSEIRWHFVGCRPNASECRYSCPVRGWMKIGTQKELCDPDDWYGAYACFCGEREDGVIS